MTTTNEVFAKWKISAVVPAAGRGTRAGYDIPKQYLEVCGFPLITYCVKALCKVQWMLKVVVVADDKIKMSNIFKKENKVIVVQGEESRHRSIMKGLMSLNEVRPDIVVIHDGVRPLVPEDILSQVVIKAVEKGAAGAVRPLVSTVLLHSQDNILEKCLRRELYRNSEMPQAFQFPMILEAYKKCSKEELELGTECLSIALNFGNVKPYLVPGSQELWKVTYPTDLKLAEMILDSYMQIYINNWQCIHCSRDNDENYTEKTRKTECIQNKKVVSSIYEMLKNKIHKTLDISNICDKSITLQSGFLLIISCLSCKNDIKNLCSNFQACVSNVSIQSVIFILHTELEETIELISSFREMLRSYINNDKTVISILCFLVDNVFINEPKLENILEICLSKFTHHLNHQILTCKLPKAKLCTA